MRRERDVLVFAGPSLPVDAAQRWPEARFAPPAQAGDVLARLGDPPAAIVLIDGCFDSCASVWHKELLLLAAAGARLWGAASMGALRAAELAGLGMTGVGSIFHAYRSGLLTGDDEVALLHAPGDLGWRALTIAMVEVRAALWLGCRRGIWRAEQARAIRREVHDIHFADRDRQAIAHLFSGRPEIRQPLLALLDDPAAAVKRRDAVRCLDLALAGAVTVAMPSPRDPPVPLTCFVRDLAARVGVTLPADRTPSPPTP